MHQHFVVRIRCPKQCVPIDWQCPSVCPFFNTLISSPTYKNVVTQFFLLQIWNLQCQIHVLSKQRTSRPIRSRDIDRSVFFQKVVCSWSYQKVVCHWMISLLYLYDNDICMSLLYKKKYISKHLASVHHNSSTLKGLFLRFYVRTRRYDILK